LRCKVGRDEGAKAATPTHHLTRRPPDACIPQLPHHPPVTTKHQPQHVSLTLIGSRKRRGGRLLLRSFEHITHCRLDLLPLAAAAQEPGRGVTARRVPILWPAGAGGSRLTHRADVTAVRLSKDGVAAPGGGEAGGAATAPGHAAAQRQAEADAAGERDSDSGGRDGGPLAAEGGAASKAGGAAGAPPRLSTPAPSAPSGSPSPSSKPPSRASPGAAATGVSTPGATAGSGSDAPPSPGGEWADVDLVWRTPTPGPSKGGDEPEGAGRLLELGGPAAGGGAQQTASGERAARGEADGADAAAGGQRDQLVAAEAAAAARLAADARAEAELAVQQSPQTVLASPQSHAGGGKPAPIGAGDQSTATAAAAAPLPPLPPLAASPVPGRPARRGAGGGGPLFSPPRSPFAAAASGPSNAPEVSKSTGNLLSSTASAYNSGLHSRSQGSSPAPAARPPALADRSPVEPTAGLLKGHGSSSSGGTAGEEDGEGEQSELQGDEQANAAGVAGAAADRSTPSHHRRGASLTPHPTPVAGTINFSLPDDSAALNAALPFAFQRHEALHGASRCRSAGSSGGDCADSRGGCARPPRAFSSACREIDEGDDESYASAVGAVPTPLLPRAGVDLLSAGIPDDGGRSPSPPRLGRQSSGPLLTPAASRTTTTGSRVVAPASATWATAGYYAARAAATVAGAAVLAAGALLTGAATDATASLKFLGGGGSRPAPPAAAAAGRSDRAQPAGQAATSATNDSPPHTLQTPDINTHVNATFDSAPAEAAALGGRAGGARPSQQTPAGAAASLWQLLALLPVQLQAWGASPPCPAGGGGVPSGAATRQYQPSVDGVNVGAAAASAAVRPESSASNSPGRSVQPDGWLPGRPAASPRAAAAAGPLVPLAAAARALAALPLWWLSLQVSVVQSGVRTAGWIVSALVWWLLLPAWLAVWLVAAPARVAWVWGRRVLRGAGFGGKQPPALVVAV
jgi:hypothetical protein